jgi:hypothetical protein
MFIFLKDFPSNVVYHNNYEKEEYFFRSYSSQSNQSWNNQTKCSSISSRMYTDMVRLLKGTPPSALSGVSGARPDENSWNFQGWWISMSRAKVVIDSKFRDPSFSEFSRSQGQKMTKSFPPRKTRAYIILSWNFLCNN